jgi:hypothetical protein
MNSATNPDTSVTLNTEGADQDFSGPTRKVEDVTCFKCGERGHYANKCPQKGQFAGGAGPPSERTVGTGDGIYECPNDKVRSSLHWLRVGS